MELLFKGDQVSAGDDDNILELNCGGGCTTKEMYFMPLNCTLEND